MAEELGKIEKPPVEDFSKSRKLILVPLIFSGQDAPQDFLKIFERCWNEIDAQLDRLQTKLGSVSRIYHEMILAPGEEGVKTLEQLNSSSHRIVKAMTEAGAELNVAEDAEMVTENMDWERCLMVAMSQKVRIKLSEMYTESSKKRYGHVGRTIDETLGQGDVGLLFVREGHQIQFPADVEVFNVYPPALDELNRWLRDYAKHGGKGAEQES